MSTWSIADSAALYNLPGWGKNLFQINKQGHVCIHPGTEPDAPNIDLKALADDLRRRDVQLPVLVRFTDVIDAQIDKLKTSFEGAIEEWSYTGSYRPVFPIKVNPQAHVLNDLLAHGSHMGLEAGSKPELMVCLAMMGANSDAPLICNGYKDAQYIRMALLGRQLGHNVIIVLEKPDELPIVQKLAAELNVEPVVGVRARLSKSGIGHWGATTGDNAKFGLSLEEIVDVVQELRSKGQLHWLKLLHFHIGSQIPHVRQFRESFTEGARIYSELHRMGAAMQYMDVGGGLGVDYDGASLAHNGSTNYDVREYAHAIVGTISDALRETGTPHPDIITESGRATVAHHSVLLTEVLGHLVKERTPGERPTGEMTPQLQRAWQIYDEIGRFSLEESLHDIQAVRRDTRQRFSLGLLGLPERAAVERMYWAVATEVVSRVTPEEESPEIEVMRSNLTDTFFCNFSVFQSTPDIWAIDQLFPIMPIHRLKEEPTRRARLADLTCDSDGKINTFIGSGEHQPYLELHTPAAGEHYDLGIFLVGAYQEILGDLHNLFGDTHAVHVVAADNRRGYEIRHLDEGELIEEVLQYVHHEPRALVAQLRKKVESATDHGQMSLEEGARLVKDYALGMDAYTYLSR